MIEMIRQAYVGKEAFSSWLTQTAQNPDLTNIAALTGMLTAFFLLSRQLLINGRQYIPSYRKEPKLLLENRQARVANLYQRIHNISIDEPHFPELKPNAFRIYNNSDNSYNHAIKLIQSGVETNKLVDFCNLSVGEAELLSAMYGNLCQTA